MATATSSRTDQRASAAAGASSLISSTTMGFAAVGLVILGHLPLVVTYFRRLLLFDHYQFAPLVLIGVPALLVLRGRSIPRPAWRGGFPGRPLVVSCISLAIASVFCSPWAAMLSLILSLGLFIRFYAGSHWRTLLPVWLLLLLIVRPPLHLDLSLITKLQIETSKVSSIVLENLGVKHLMEGNVLVIPQRRFLVEEACSGINSVFALLTAAAFYAVCVRATLVRSVLLIGSAVFWACLMNLVRVAATIFAFEQLQMDLGEGAAHTITGFVTFALAVVFVSFTDQMVRFFLDPIDPKAVEFWKLKSNPFVQWWNRTGPQVPDVPPRTTVMTRSLHAAVPATIAIGGLSLFAAGWQYMALQAELEEQTAPAVIANLEADSIPAQLGNWSQHGYEIERRQKNSILGDISKIWTYRSGPHAAMVSVDYPFRGWHALAMCYQGQGWQIDEYGTVPLATTEDGPRTLISEAKMHRPSGERAVLLFTLLNRQGQPLHDPATGSDWLQLTRRAVERLKRPFAQQFPELAPDFGVTTQFQMLVVSDGEAISPAVEDDARAQFAALQSTIAGLLASEHVAASAGDKL